MCVCLFAWLCDMCSSGCTVQSWGITLTMFVNKLICLWWWVESQWWQVCSGGELTVIRLHCPQSLMFDLCQLLIIVQLYTLGLHNHHLQQGHLQCIFSWSWSESSTHLSYVSLGKTVWYLNTNQMTVSKLSLSDARYPFIRVQVGIYWTSMWKQETKKRTFEVAERKNESLTS